MSKKVYLTFDIETVVSKLSYNPTYYASVIMGGLDIAWELKKRNLKGTFYISLSPKAKEIDLESYLDGVKLLVTCLKPFDNIKIEPHIHAFSLPMNFATSVDQFSSYSQEQQYELLKWAKEFFEELNITVENFRPGSYSANTSYYDALLKAGYKTSSLLLKDQEINIDLIEGKVSETPPFTTVNGIVEYPVTSVKIKTIKNGKTEIINLSPDFLRIESVADAIEKLNYVNINFHSFSMYNNRLARENHKGQLKNNLKFMFFEKWINMVLRKFGLETINHQTIFKNEFIKWIDHLEQKKYDTYFIGK